MMLHRSLPIAPALLLLLQPGTATAQNGAAWSCPAAFSNGPCFTAAKSWHEAQATCESHGSSLATVRDVDANDALAANGCFSAAPWNDWQCSWIGLNDLRAEGAHEWASGGAAFTDTSFNAWGTYEPDANVNNTDNCAAVCNGGDLAGYGGNFWVDFDCNTMEFEFCCDVETYVQDVGTAADSSFLENLPDRAWASSLTAPTLVDPDPYEERRMCFSTDMPWHDAQAICESIGTHLITIHTEEEMNHMGDTVHFSRVPDSWGLDWRCFWLGMHDRNEENGFEWISGKRPAFTPPFGPFEGANGDGAEEDCIAMCQSDCDHKKEGENCTDLSEYGYSGNFLIDASCNDAYGFCCEGLAVEYVEMAKNSSSSAMVSKTRHDLDVAAASTACLEERRRLRAIEDGKSDIDTGSISTACSYSLSYIAFTAACFVGMVVAV